MATIKGYLHYTQIKRPSTNFEPQWRVQLEVDKKTAQQFKKDYSASKNSVKEYTTEEFTEAFKTEPQAQPEADEHYVLNIKQGCYIGDKPFENPPRVFMRDEDTGKLKDVTKSTEVGNGSYGIVQINPYYSKRTKKTSAKLANVVVESLVHYEGGGGADLSELGDIDQESLSDNSTSIPEKSSEDDNGNDDDDDDVPFDEDDVAY